MNRTILSVVTIALLVVGFGTANAATTLMEIGRSPFHQPPLTTVDSLKSMVETKSPDVKKGFEKAGKPELYEPFVAQLPAAEVETVEFEKGSYFQWMFFKKKGKGAVRVAKDVTWGNDRPFTGFKFDIDHEEQRYTFAVPLGCGNIALVGVQPVPAPAPAPEPVTPAPVAAIAPTPEPVAEEPAPMAEAAPVSPLRFLADIGYSHQPDPANYIIARIGLEYVINDQFSVLGMIGGAPHVRGSDGESAFLIDVLGEYKFGSRYFIDLGLGGWITDGDSDIPAENSQVDLIAGIGARIFGEPEEFNGSLFIEMRSAFDELDELNDYGRFGAGIRFRF